MSNTELHTGTLTPVKTINSHQGFIDFVYENELTGYLASSIEIYLDELLNEAEGVKLVKTKPY